MATDLLTITRSADLLTTIRSEIKARLSELRPLIREYEDLIGAAEALAEAPAEATAPRRPGRPRRGAAAGAPAAGKASAARTRRTPRSSSRATAPAPAKPAGRARRGAAEQAIMAALEHGSHTTSELVMVTAMSAQNIRGNLSRLERGGTIAKTKRDGRTAYVLSSTSV
jgi:hypothetical protein